MAETRIVVITGGSSGIGRATAHLLAGRGEHLVLVARGPERLHTTADECRAMGAASVTTHSLDVADRNAVDALFAAVVAERGRVDGVVNSAGVAAYGRFTDVDPEVLETVMATNYLGTANVARAALRQFAEQGGGSLVLVGSLLGKIATPYMSPYVSSKWAVHGLVRILQIEARDTPEVGVSLVSPGGVDTPIYRWSATVLGRQGQPPPPVDPPEKVGRAVVRALDRPRRETSVGLANPVAVLGFRVLPSVYDWWVGPLMRTFGLEKDGRPAHSGNIFSSQPDAGPEAYGQSDPGAVRLLRRVVNRTAALLSRPGGSVVPDSTRHRTSATRSTPVQPVTTETTPGRVLVEHRMNASAQQVWSVLADGWLYANWVVGASRTRDVEPGWPGVGAHIHHSFGIWPTVINDTTEVLESVPTQRLRLRAQGGPTGAAEVEITLRADGREATLVGIREDAVAGPGLLVPQQVRQALIVPRNREALRRMAYLAEGRGPSRTRDGGATG